MKRDFLSIRDFQKDELQTLLALAARMKAGGYTERPLEGRSIALIFEKSSTRTRVSFDVGTYQLGGHPVVLTSRDTHLGRGEPIEDTARVLSRYVDGIVIRSFGHDRVQLLAQHASVPVINGLTDLLHPCQVLADLLTVQEHNGDLAGLTVAWVGDGNNMANSWLNAASSLGFRLQLACPDGYQPDPAIVEQAAASADILLTDDPARAVEGAHAVNTDVWTSMGQEAESAARERAFQGYMVDRDLMSRAATNAIFLHCLPAHRGEEVSAEVIDGPQSRVFDEAENRLHVQKALLAMLLSG